jgi:hypothetical protein
VPPDQSKSASEGAKGPTIGLGERLKNGFSCNWKNGWRRKDLEVDNLQKTDFEGTTRAMRYYHARDRGRQQSQPKMVNLRIGQLITLH